MPQKRRGTAVRNHYHQSTGNMDYIDVSTRPTDVYGIQAFNTSSGNAAYLRVYDLASGISSVTSTGGTVPDGVWAIPAAVSPSTVGLVGGIMVPFPEGWNLRRGLSYSLSTGIADNDTHGVAAATVFVNFQFDSTYVL